MKNIFPMSHIYIFIAVLLLIATQAFGQEESPFSLSHFGHAKKMMHNRTVAGVVALSDALPASNVYAVGAIAGGIGEITVIDGRIWIDYGADGLGKAKEIIPADEQAVLLVLAQVEKWQSVPVPKDMAGIDLHLFILDLANALGLDRDKPFPFLLEGAFEKMDWHVINGLKEGPAEHIHGGIFNKLTEHREKAVGSVVGFYSAAGQGTYTHPGESWHLHIVFSEEDAAGHIDALKVQKGAILKLPVMLTQ